MPLYGRDRNRISTEVVKALAHPVRFQILQLHTGDPSRPLTASTFFPELVGEFKDLTLKKVHYHLTQLQKVELLPA
jgi:hypothetical protein